MRKLTYYIGVSIDGRIAGPGGETAFFPVGEGAAGAAYADWVNARYPETVPEPYRLMAGVEGVPNKRFDTVVMGMDTYRVVLDQGLASPYPHLRQYVVSASRRRIAEPAVTLAEVPTRLVADLKREDGLDIWLCGGGRLAGSLLPEIDELIIKSYPVIAGAAPAGWSRMAEAAWGTQCAMTPDHRPSRAGASPPAPIPAPPTSEPGRPGS